MPWDLCFVKIFFGSSEGFTHFVEWDNFWVNILRDIDIYFIPFVHANYLVFFSKVEARGPWVGELFLLARRRCLLF
jgi:hypothetical protein